MRVEISNDAKLDLSEAESFSRERWGVERTRRYMAELRSRMKLLRRDYTLGTRRLDVNESARSVRAGRHVIFYRVDDDRVLVTRVLHDARDAPRHLRT